MQWHSLLSQLFLPILNDIEIPVLDKRTIDEITDLVKQVFELKDTKKQLIKQVREKMDSYFPSEIKDLVINFYFFWFACLIGFYGYNKH